MIYPTIDPVAIAIGPLSIHWYGLMYVFGFVGAWWLGKRRAKQYGWRQQEVEDVLFYGAIGVIVGGRVGYALFYDFANVIVEPWRIFMIWQGGMSFHGGLIGVLIAFAVFATKTQRHYLAVSDFIAPLVPIGLFFGRIGNFINGELWGKVSDVPWAMVFPNGGLLPRHPSQLYEAVLEGIVLWLILWLYSAKPRPAGAVSGLFLFGYGLFRSLVELVRVPDYQYGYLLFDWVTMGQILSMPMMVLGLFFIWRAYRGQ